MAMIEQGLGCKPTIEIPDLGKQLGKAANLGKPAVGESAVFRRVMALLAQEVSGTPVGQMHPAGDRSLLRRILGR